MILSDNQFEITYPKKAVVELTRKCNLQCPACPIGNGDANLYPDMPYKDYQRIIMSTKGIVESLALFNYGEPLLYPDIANAIKYAKDSGIRKVSISSNGLLLDNNMSSKLINAGLDMIRISIDATNQETYQQYRYKGNFRTLIKNISNFIRIREQNNNTSAHTEVQYIIMRHNESKLEQFRNMFRNIGVDSIIFKTFNAGMSWDKPQRKEFLPYNKAFSRYRDIAGLLPKRGFRRSQCPWPRKMFVVNCNKTIVPCCYDYNNDFILGKVIEAKFMQWWATNNRKLFIKTLLKNPNLIKICKNCQRGYTNITQY